MAAFSYSLGGPGDLVLFGCFQGGWVGVKGNCWEMKSMGPCFRPGWARLGVGSCHFICSADPTESLEDVVCWGLAWVSWGTRFISLGEGGILLFSGTLDSIEK